MRRTLLFVVCLSFLALIGCSETVNVPSRPPSVEFDVLEADGNVVDVYYWVTDPDRDDVDIEIQVCRQDNCFVPTQAPGGDGTENLPTSRDEPALHLYRWAAGCDLEAAEFDDELVIEILPNDTKNEGEPAQSAPFTLNSLGLEPGCS